MFQPSPKSSTSQGVPPAGPEQPNTTGGEFTRLFNSPLPENPLGPATGRDDWPPAAPQKEEPGAFTRMFQAQNPAAPRKEEPPPQGGEFTRFFKPQGPQGPQFPAAPLPPPNQGPMPQQAPPPRAPSGYAPSSNTPPGDFTRMFGKSALGADAAGTAPPPSAAPPASQPMAPPQQVTPPQQMTPQQSMPAYGNESATGAFRRQAQPGGPTPEPVQQGPSEYTMIVKRSSLPQPGAAGGAAPAPPGQSPGTPIVQVNIQGPQMPQVYVPQVQMPTIPQPQIPGVQGVSIQQPQIPQIRAPQLSVPSIPTPQATVSVPAPSMPKWLPFAIIGLLAFLGGIVVMLLVMKK
jgi:hypothetical protein